MMISEAIPFFGNSKVASDLDSPPTSLRNYSDTGDERKSLLGRRGGSYGERDEVSNADDSGLYSSDALYRNFYAMSIAFSINVGCVITCLAFASTELGNSIGGVSNGILYVGYAITALFFARPLVSSLGPKLVMFLGTVGNSVYVCGFFLSIVLIDFKYTPAATLAWVVSTVTSLVGGFAGGLLWTSQGWFSDQEMVLFQ